MVFHFHGFGASSSLLKAVAIAPRVWDTFWRHLHVVSSYDTVRRFNRVGVQQGPSSCARLNKFFSCSRIRLGKFDGADNIQARKHTA